ncbi:MAG TPA: FAD-binding oxidoreductase, partial [Solirubrobacteraceae bacterium]|nr:FAD-binding oxidoreductase [Solirubrobacteraceae bacterium]
MATTQPTPSLDTLPAALADFTNALGGDRVLTSAADLETFRDPFQFPGWDDYTASAVLMPETVGEIQEIVRIASRHGVPLWTHSTGRNNGYGGPAPRVSGSVIVSLRNMNKVLEIDEELGYAVVEPGVRWFDLYEAIKAGGHKLMLSIADLGWGSIVGNTLDHGVTYMPYGVDMGMQCGMEVVLPSGELMRTGMGAMPNNRSWHLYKRGLGPTPDQLFMQSNFGIVTKMGVWLMPFPETYMPIWVRAWRDDDVAPMLDTLRRLSLDGTIRMVPQVGNTLIFASFMSRRAEWWDGEGPIPEPVIERIARELETGRWMMRAALYGDEAIVEHRFAKVKAAFESIPGVEVWGTKSTPAQAPGLAHPAERTQAGVPDLEMNFMTGWYGGEGSGGHVGF